MQSLIVTIAIVFCSTGAGCDFVQYGFGPHPRTPRYSFGFANVSGTRVHEARVDFVAQGRGYDINVGVLSVGSMGEWDGMPDPIPAKGTVLWHSDDDGKDHAEVVEIASHIKDLKRFKGTIWFKISEKRVEVIPIGDDERDAGKTPFN